jgi:ArsR family transcriptional regulator
METKFVLRALAALAQENRLAIYRLLVQAGQNGRSVGEIAEELGIANATLSFHLKELTNAGLIEARQDGRFIYYSANYAQMSDLLAFLTDNCCGGEAACAPVKCAPSARSTPSSREKRGARSAAKLRAVTR